MQNQAPALVIPYTVALPMVRYHVALELLKRGKCVKDLFDDANYTPALVEEAMQKHINKVAALQP